MSRIWLVAKYVAAVALVLFAALLGLGWYLGSKQEQARRNSPFLQRLEQTEREKGDLLKVLFDGAGTVNDDEAKLAVEWLLPRQFRGEHPYLYIVGLYYGRQSDNRRRFQGLEYFLRAALVYRVDAGKCGDPTANQAVPILESALGMKMVRDNLKAKPDVRQKVIADALAFEEKNKDRPRPEWICIHGIRRGPPPAEDIQRTHRHRVREQFSATF